MKSEHKILMLNKDETKMTVQEYWKSKRRISWANTKEIIHPNPPKLKKKKSGNHIYY